MISEASANSCKGCGPNKDKSPDPLDPDQPPPLDRYCDLVLEGGVTEGVVYPWAIVELARAYRFKNLCGTSVGAVAVALTAAAEYNRRKGSVSGFNEVLLPMPEKLGEDVGGGKTKIFSLFQPVEKTQRLFDMFVGIFRNDGSATCDKAKTAGSFGRYVLPVLPAYRFPATLGLALAFLIGV